MAADGEEKGFRHNKALVVAGALLLLGIAGGLLFKHQAQPDGSASPAPSQESAAGAGPENETAVESVREHSGVNATSDAVTSSSGWDARLRTTENYRDLVSDAVLAASAGDGRAAYIIMGALHDCVIEITQVRAGIDPQATFVDEQRRLDSRFPNRPGWVRERDEKRLRRCVELAKNDPFGRLPARDGGYYSSAYWLERAVELGDPVAKADISSSLLTAAADGAASDAKRVALEQAQTHFREALQTKDARALFVMGSTLIDKRYSSDPSRGLAMTLAACEMDLDCSNGTPLVSRSRCESVGECAPAVDYRELLLRDLGARDYASLYARAQEIRDLLNRGDWDALAPYVTVDGSLVRKLRSP